ncbi:glutathione S-transferase family protein [Methyloferula stellata]|uniref:glutathione S-transferase family protein n=1 Tax=Methyloferula stellata TaxID=876270 RepID=UPI00037CAB9B|nr:glutathione S-transferase family protein [Methyloferula stellata]
MITLYTFGPLFDLPDASPFVVKAMLLLKFAGLPYKEERGGFRKAPKGKLPFIVDDGAAIADSTFIRFHIETKYGVDFDAGLSPGARATAWALEKMCEDHLYWALVDMRWCDMGNFERSVARFFDWLPAPVRPLAKIMIRRMVVRRLNVQGMGRHRKEEIAELAIRDLEALAAVLGEKAFLMGDAPCGADATVFGFVGCLLSPACQSPIRAAAENHANLVAYRDRLLGLYFPGFSGGNLPIGQQAEV